MIFHRMREFVLLLVWAATLGAAFEVHAGTVSESLLSTEDSMAVAMFPDSTYGSAGAVSVAGDDSVNGLGQPRGRAESLYKFNTASAIANFDKALGSGKWTIVGATLQLTEFGSPPADFFAQGAGAFAVNWLSNDDWSQGVGTPFIPGIGKGNQLTWNYLQNLLGSTTVQPLGAFASYGADGQHLLPLALDGSFATDLIAGGDITLHLSPADNSIGCTLHSKEFFIAESQPLLILTAEAVATCVPADLNCDQMVNVDDLVVLLASWGPCTGKSCHADIAPEGGDGHVNVDDLVVLLASWG